MHASGSPIQIQPQRSFRIARDFRRAIEAARTNDRQLTAQVKTALLAAGDITAKQILIEAIDGVVSLSGTVDSEAMRDATLATVRMEPGVRSVDDQLVLRSELNDALARRRRKRRI